MYIGKEACVLWVVCIFSLVVGEVGAYDFGVVCFVLVDNFDEVGDAIAACVEGGGLGRRVGGCHGVVVVCMQGR